MDCQSSNCVSGDAVRDEENQAAVFDDSAASAPTSLGGLNLIVTYGLLDGNETTTRDCSNAYAQSILSSPQPTFVLLPIGLVPDHVKHFHQPCAPLIKSLYGHPLASVSWRVLAEPSLQSPCPRIREFEFEQLPSWFIFQVCNWHCQFI
jgi:hypothetical protein